MKVLCRYSGQTFNVTGFNSLYLKNSSAHPIMFTDTKTLLSRTADWSNDTLDQEECKLLFIALLKTTELVEFRTAANPDILTVKKNMDRLLLTVGWRHATGDAFPVPKFFIDHSTSDLTSIASWLDAWNDAKADWETKGVGWSLSQKLALREAALMKMIRSPSRKEDSYAKQMAKYVFELTSAPSYIQPYWTEIFCLKDNIDIWKVPEVDYDELKEWMETHLQPTTLIAHDAFMRLRRLVNLNKKGIMGGLGMLDDEDFLEDSIHPNSPGVPNFSILASGDNRSKEAKDSRYSMPSFATTEDHNLQVILARAPLEQPFEKDYSTRVAYLRALASWRVKEAETKKGEAKASAEKVKELEVSDDKDSWEEERDEEFVANTLQFYSDMKE